MLKVGIAGVGGISGAHISAWRRLENAKIIAMCDSRVERMDSYEDVVKYTDLDEMLEKEELDVLDIILPTYLHAPVALKAMKKGIHVLCEKPISLKEEDVRMLYDAAEKNNVFFMVAHVIRFWPEYMKLKEIHDSGKYGKLLSGSMKRLSAKPKWSWDNWMSDPERSGMVPYDLHIHDLDFMMYTFGNPTKVVPYRVNRPEQDYLQVIYEYDNFFISAESSWYAARYPFRAEFRFLYEEAIVAMENGKLVVYKNDGIMLTTEAPEGEENGEAVLQLPATGGYYNEIKYFADCVMNNQKATIMKPEELENVIRILNSI